MRLITRSFYNKGRKIPLSLTQSPQTPLMRLLLSALQNSGLPAVLRNQGSSSKRSGWEVVSVRIYSGGECAEIKGFFDSGNKVYCRGAPVSIIPKEIAEKIVDGLPAVLRNQGSSSKRSGCKTAVLIRCGLIPIFTPL